MLAVKQRCFREAEKSGFRRLACNLLQPRPPKSNSFVSTRGRISRRYSYRTEILVSLFCILICGAS